jgi:hypothetical protein
MQCIRFPGGVTGERPPKKIPGCAAAGGAKRADDAEVGRVKRAFAAAPRKQSPHFAFVPSAEVSSTFTPPHDGSQLSAQANVEHRSLCESEGYRAYRSLPLILLVAILIVS